LIAAKAVVTSRGGMTSHAAVVARGMGKPAVCGCEEMTIDLAAETLSARGRTFKKGDFVTVDGSSGTILAGQAPLVEPTFGEDFKKVLSWADKFAKQEVWANADTPEDATRAIEFGAKGIGLCRTEHMFMATDRLPVVQELILADTLEERKAALDKLKPMQKGDFVGIFEAMKGYPVIIRLLDPPLHEFLPNKEVIKEEFAELNKKGQGQSNEALRLKKILDKIEQLHESNPMLGFRGCRLGMIYPEISEMQIYAILEAATELVAKGVNVCPEIMIPLVGVKAEMKFFREMAERIAEEVEKKSGVKLDNLLIGTMIEVPRAAIVADELAEHAEFFSFGTNDLTQTAFGYSRDDAEGKFLFQYVEKGVFKENPFSELDRGGVGELMKIAVEKGRKVVPNLSIGICGEHGGNPSSIAFCCSIGMNYVSCSPFRIPVARVAAAHFALGTLK
jgi:pyruvate,orthophosphate dikinase